MASAAADALEQVVEPRNGVIHSHPATFDSQQTLYRWAVVKGAKAQEAYAVTEDSLIELRDLALEHLLRLNEVRLPG